jgi:uroporphyrinogen-III synthase
VQADIARPVAVDGLQAKGWDVTPVAAYRTLAVEAEPVVVEAIAAAHAITFTSGSTVRSFVAAYGIDLLPDRVISIGPVTTDACSELGIRVTVTATEHNIDGLVAATVTCLS